MMIRIIDFDIFVSLKAVHSMSALTIGKNFKALTGEADSAKLVRASCFYGIY